MKNFRRILMALLCVVAANSLPANAGIISAGTQIFNIDFTAAGSYSSVEIVFAANPFNLAAGQDANFADFPDFNALGTLGSEVSASGPIGPVDLTITFAESSADFLDGLFSLRIELNTGSFAFTSLTASIFNAAGAVVATQTLTPSAVPEPATLALLGLAIAGIGFSRRRQS